MLAEAIEEDDMMDVVDSNDDVVMDVDGVEDGGEGIEFGDGVDRGDIGVVGEDADVGRVVELKRSTLVTAARTSVTTSVVGEADRSCAALTILTVGFDEVSVLLELSFVTTCSIVWVGPFSSTTLVVINVVVAGDSDVVTVLV